MAISFWELVVTNSGFFAGREDSDPPSPSPSPSQAFDSLVLKEIWAKESDRSLLLLRLHGIFVRLNPDDRAFGPKPGLGLVATAANRFRERGHAVVGD